jgi:hypothetical protein
LDTVRRNSDHLSPCNCHIESDDNYMMIGDLNYDLMCPITNTRDKCLTKYENYRIEVRWYRAGVLPCDILVPHIDSRVKMIDNERPGASPCDLLLVIEVLPCC